MNDKNFDNQSCFKDLKHLKWKTTKLLHSLNKVGVNGPCQPFTDCWFISRWFLRFSVRLCTGKHISTLFEALFVSVAQIVQCYMP